MNPILKTDAWALAQAYSGIDVTVQMHTMPGSIGEYTRRLHKAGEFLGLSSFNVVHDNEGRFMVGKAGIRLAGLDAARSPGEFWFKQFPANDTSALVEGRDLLELFSDLKDIMDTDAHDEKRGGPPFRDPLEYDDIESFGL